MTNSRNKGKVGELEWVHFLKDHGINARRSQQFCGTSGDADVISDLPFHWEVKRVEKLNIDNAMEQAIRDTQGNIPVVAHRKNRKEWLCTLRAEDLLSLIRERLPSK